MRAAAVLVALVACSNNARQPDRRIAAEYRELWDARSPAMVRTPCANAETVVARIEPFLQLALDTRKTWQRWDEPLPPELAGRLAAVDPGPSPAADLRCLVEQPTAPGGGWTLLGVSAALLVHKGEQTVKAGDATGWRWVAESLRVFHRPPSQVYIHFFQPAWLLERATALARAVPPDAASRADLAAAARDATMTQATYCAGLEEELLAHGASTFYGHITELRGELVDRWGPELEDLYQPDFARRALPSYATWQAFRRLAEPIRTACATMTPRQLREVTRPLLAALADHESNIHSLMQVALSRGEHLERLHAAGESFQRQLAAAP